MFDERAFVTSNQSRWNDLSVMLERIKLSGLRSIPPSQLSRLGSLYRRCAADLAYSRTQNATDELVFYLNELVGQGHGILYQQTSERSMVSTVLDFFSWDLPQTMRRRMPFVLVAFGLTMLGILVAYMVVRADPANLDLFVPPALQSSIDAWKEGFADHGTVSAGDGAMFSAYLMTHNTQVGLVAAATGITSVMPIFFMFQNGAMMGALVAVVQPTGHLTSMWAGLAPHGICELGAIFIDGGAGLLIGWAFIHPGNLRRRDALIINSKDAAKMVVGTVPMFVIAGLLEGNVSHAELPHYVKFTLAAVQFSALMFYIYGDWTRDNFARSVAAKSNASVLGS